MKQLVLRGLRGGIGATSLLAGLGIALHEQGERVLLIDLSPDNMLRLHFSVDVAYASGWRARSWMLHHGMRVPWNCSRACTCCRTASLAGRRFPRSKASSARTRAAGRSAVT